MDILTFQTLLSFAITCAVIEITPGPNMAYLAILSISEGRKAGYAAVIGVALGLLSVGLAAAMGLAALISNSYTAYQILRWGGVLYLLWLAWDGWHTTKETSAHITHKAGQGGKFFKRGLITNLLNPKAAIFYIAILPGFLNPLYYILAQTVFLTILYVTIATIIHIGIVFLAGSARKFLEDPKKNLIARRVLSLVLAGIAVWFAFATAT